MLTLYQYGFGLVWEYQDVSSVKYFLVPFWGFFFILPYFKNTYFCQTYIGFDFLQLLEKGPQLCQFLGGCDDTNMQTKYLKHKS